GDLGFGCQAKAPFGEYLRVGIADGLIDGLGHHRSPIDFPEMAHRYLARTKAVETDLVLEVYETRPRLGVEVRCRNADLEFMLQSVSDDFLHLHGVDLLLAWPGQLAGHLQLAALGCDAAGGLADPRPKGKPPDGKSVGIRHAQTQLALGAGGGTRTPTTF